MWDLMLTELYSPPQILKIASTKWGFRTKQYKRRGGTELSNSGIYRMFSNIFYAGICLYNGRKYKGSHSAMIPLEEFDRVQILLAKKGKPRPQKHSFAFTGLIRCKECGCLFTAERKLKYIKSTGITKEYIYYRCTKKKRHTNCSQKPITEEELNRQIKKEIEEREKLHKNKYQTFLNAQKQLDNLTQMRYKELITDEELKRKK
jgi:hypothetical protein